MDNMILIIALLWHSIRNNLWALLALVVIITVTTFAGIRVYKEHQTPPMMKCYEHMLEKKGGLTQAGKDECKELVEMFN
jgi:hypothetical protein